MIARYVKWCLNQSVGHYCSQKPVQVSLVLIRKGALSVRWILYYIRLYVPKSKLTLVYWESIYGQNA